jgi:hypothetical protein
LRGDSSKEITFLAPGDEEKLQFSSIIFSWLLFLSLSTKAFALISHAIFGKAIGDLLDKGRNAPLTIEMNSKVFERTWN